MRRRLVKAIAHHWQKLVRLLGCEEERGSRCGGLLRAANPDALVWSELWAFGLRGNTRKQLFYSPLLSWR